MHLQSGRDLLEKLRRTWRDGTLFQKAGVELHRQVVMPVRLYSQALCASRRLPAEDRALSVARGFADHRADVRHHTPTAEQCERIIAAYLAAKADEHRTPPALQVRGQWAQWWVKENFKEMVAAIRARDTAALSALLADFHRRRISIGLGSSFEEWLPYTGLHMRRFYMRQVFCEYRDLLLAADLDAAEIRMPLIGNPAGIPWNGEIITLCALRHMYHALEFAHWLRDVPAATVVEIGGGVGSQAYQALRLAGGAIGQYVIFDLPEVAAMSAYQLLAACPEKRVRLYGEGPVAVGAGEDYGIGIFPHFTIETLPADSVDLFHNACSFSEMDSASSQAYLKVIERAGRRFFSHINHDNPFRFYNDDGSVSVNTLARDLVPDRTRFKRVFKKPRVYTLPEDRLQHFISNEYLYERLNPSVAAAPRVAREASRTHEAECSPHYDLPRFPACRKDPRPFGRTRPRGGAAVA